MLLEGDEDNGGWRVLFPPLAGRWDADGARQGAPVTDPF